MKKTLPTTRLRRVFGASTAWPASEVLPCVLPCWEGGQGQSGLQGCGAGRYADAMSKTFLPLVGEQANGRRNWMGYGRSCICLFRVWA